MMMCGLIGRSALKITLIMVGFGIKLVSKIFRQKYNALKPLCIKVLARCAMLLAR